MTGIEVIMEDGIKRREARIHEIVENMKRKHRSSIIGMKEIQRLQNEIKDLRQYINNIEQ